MDKLKIFGKADLSGSIEIPGAKNAALLAASILGLSDDKIKLNLKKFRDEQTKGVLEQKLNIKS